MDAQAFAPLAEVNGPRSSARPGRCAATRRKPRTRCCAPSRSSHPWLRRTTVNQARNRLQALVRWRARACTCSPTPRVPTPAGADGGAQRLPRALRRLPERAVCSRPTRRGCGWRPDRCRTLRCARATPQPPRRGTAAHRGARAGGGAARGRRTPQGWWCRALDGGRRRIVLPLGPLVPCPVGWRTRRGPGRLRADAQGPSTPHRRRPGRAGSANWPTCGGAWRTPGSSRRPSSAP